jgi:hypothetical protein
VKLFNVPLSSGDAKSVHVVVVVELVAIVPEPSIFSASTLSKRLVKTIAPEEELLEDELELEDDELELDEDELLEELDEVAPEDDDEELELDEEELELDDDELELDEEELELDEEELDDELLDEDELVDVGQLTVVFVILLELLEELGSVVVVVTVA